MTQCSQASSRSRARRHHREPCTALVIAPTCGSGNCRIWVGVSGGGVWRTDDALAPNPSWTWPNGGSSRTRSVTRARSHRPEATRSTSAPVRATAARPAARPAPASTSRPTAASSWKKLADACVSNATYPCVNPGKDAFLGRGINALVIDPPNATTSSSARHSAVRGLSHTIGNGGTTRLEPGANHARPLRVDRRRQDVHRGLERQRRRRLRRHDVGLDPLDPERRLRLRVRRGCVAARRWRPATPYGFRRSSPRSSPAAGSTARCSP